MGKEKVMQALEDWIIRVSSNLAKKTPEEVVALPGIVKEFLRHCEMSEKERSYYSFSPSVDKNE